MRGCDHQSIPLLFLKLRGRDECEGQRDRVREREGDRQRDGRVEADGAREYSTWKQLRQRGR